MAVGVVMKFPGGTREQYDQRVRLMTAEPVGS
jgi:hypothetical protein